MATTLPPAALAGEAARIDEIGAAFAARYPGESSRRQPVHTVYGGAHLFRSDSAAKLGGVATRLLDRYAPDAATFAAVIGYAGDDGLPERLYDRVRDKLRREPVEDFRIDFEDGYGNRPDEEEDGHALGAAGEIAHGLAAGMLPPVIGIRIKPLTPELGRRAIRTLDLFLTALLERTGGALPPNFVITLAKVTGPEQADVLAGVLQRLEVALGLADRTLVFEFMVETPQIVLGANGRCALPEVLRASAGRAVAAHFGTYDYTAACNITAAHQHMRHPACDFARQVMQVAFAGTGLWLSDGATAVLPVPPHRGEDLPADRERENRDVVHRAWRLHHDDIQHSLALGFYQGWDLHPGQLPTRFGAVYSFFLHGLDAAGQRLRNFVERAAQATLVGEVFDDAATGQGLLNYFLRAINCGAVTEEEALARTGLTLDELRGRSFVRILRARREAPTARRRG